MQAVQNFEADLPFHPSSKEGADSTSGVFSLQHDIDEQGSQPGNLVGMTVSDRTVFSNKVSHFPVKKAPGRLLKKVLAHGQGKYVEVSERGRPELITRGKDDQ
jgi:hypothetical protein